MPFRSILGERNMHLRYIGILAAVVGALSPVAWPQGSAGLQRWAAGKKRALVVGIEGYEESRIPPAKFADRDADALAEALRTGLSSPYDEVVALTNAQATHDPILTALERLSDRSGPRDTLLVFFACHGIPKKSEVFLAPHDMKQSLTVKGISIKDVVQRYLENSAAGQKLLLLDTCYSGVAVDVDEQGRVQWGRGEQRGFAGVTQALVERDETLAIITAASNDQASWGDPESKHGFFTKHLLAALTGLADRPPSGNYDGFLTADEAYAFVCDRVYDEVYRRHQVRQRPKRLFAGAQLLLANVEPGRYELELRSEPSPANVFIGNRPSGTTPLKTRCRVGQEYRIVIAKRGFEDWEDRLLWHKDEPVRWTARLQPKGSKDPRLPLGLRYLGEGKRDLGVEILSDLAKAELAEAPQALVALCQDALKQDDLTQARQWAAELRARFPQSARVAEADRAVYHRCVRGTEDLQTVEGLRARTAALDRFCRLDPQSTVVPEARRERQRLRDQIADWYAEKTSEQAQSARHFIKIDDFGSAKKAVARIQQVQADAKRLDGIELDDAVVARLGQEIAVAEQDRAFGQVQAAAIQAERRGDLAGAMKQHQDFLATRPPERHAQKARSEYARLEDAKTLLEAQRRREQQERRQAETGRARQAKTDRMRQPRKPEQKPVPLQLSDAFIVPKEDKDQYGNPVTAREGNKVDPATGWPFEIWLKGDKVQTVIEEKKGWIFKKTVKRTVTIERPHMELVLIPAGQFMMGSENGGDDEQPVHQVRITKPFYVGKYEVTQAQWEAVVGSQPWKGGSYAKANPRHAASYVRWDDCQEFVKKLSAATRGQFRLPTEAQWEYACRAGTTTRYSFGDDAAKLEDYGWYDDNAYDIGEKYAHGVGLKRPNPWGLYDVHGNVWEWCQDHKRTYTNAAQTDPQGPEGSFRVLRGGSWDPGTTGARSARRVDSPHRGPWFRRGLRVCCVSCRPSG